MPLFVARNMLTFQTRISNFSQQIRIILRNLKIMLFINLFSVLNTTIFNRLNGGFIQVVKGDLVFIQLILRLSLITQNNHG